MQNILAKIGAFFEAHVEKIVLGIAGIVGIWLLLIFVIMNPNAVTYDNQTFSPGSIDQYIYDKKAVPVQAELNQSSVSSEDTYHSYLNSSIDVNDPLLEGFNTSLPKGFLGLFACSIDHIDSGVIAAVPAQKTTVVSDGREYSLPFIGQVSDVLVEYIRAAGYVPVEAVTEQKGYRSVERDVNDMDLVTVQARFDIAALRDRFHECFAGGGLPEPWRDETMANPVFAAVNLQRREQLPNNRWGDWENVPHIATIPNTDTYRIIEKADELPAGGIRVRMIKLNEDTARINVLQPEPYEIATTYDEWLPPEFHGKYLVERQKEESEKRREERDAERENNNQRDNSRRGRTGLNNQQNAGGRNQMNNVRGGRRGNQALDDRNGLNAGRGGVNNDRNARRGGGRANQNDPYALDGRLGREQTISPVEEIFEEFEEIRLSPLKDFSRVDELVFWSHDASPDTGKTYQYRIRLGVLNPVAGLGSVVEKDQDLKDQVILWSDFSAATDLVEIPKRQYIFANTFQESANSVTMEVAKFTQGYWRSELFSVKPGETIGREVEIEPEEEEEDVYARAGGRGMVLEEVEPEIIDFSTGVVFVGIERTNTWTGSTNLRPQTYFDMLYSVNGVDIEKTPIGSKNWNDELKKANGNIKRMQREPIEEFRTFGSSRSSQSNTTTGMRDNRNARMPLIP